MRAILAWLLWITGAVVVASGTFVTEESPWATVALVLGGLSMGIVGLVLVLRGRVAMGWIFLALQAASGLSAHGLGNGNEMFFALAITLLLFPTGRLPTPRWKWAWWVIGIDAVLVVGGDYLGWLPDGFEAYLVMMLSLIVVMVASVIRLAFDYRRSTGERRQQLKFLVWVLLLGGAILLLSLIPLPYLSDAHELAGIVLMVGSPIAIGLAVTRYGLYEIDRLISRTVSYTLVVAVLAGLVAIISTLVATRFDSPMVVAATTLGVAALFNPLRSRVQGWVDRRFNRSKYDHELVAERFTASLRGDVDFDGLVDGWLGVVSETMQPRQMSVWTRIS